ncbi:hypothetical protein [Streptomyces sp. NPDC058252]|uniref:hypothetical protein n=1 Tax=Streptomyces sp. NPDC058252 TaxID=3346405 RepID=UPI0036E637BB
MLHEYHALKQGGKVANIAGFAVEGPLLGPQGGIPRAGRWHPSKEEWRTLADLGPYGLRYIVMAPDGAALSEEVASGLTFGDLLRSLYEQGTRVALGHFHRDAPERSADRMRAVVDFLHGRFDSSPYLILTDHLYNDMPRTFVHTWRTPDERISRAEELQPLLEADWEKADLSALLGPVPATMLHLAQQGALTPCINFDGAHVDLEICRLTVQYLGADRLIALTDHTEVPTMAREPLRRSEHNGLWLRGDGAVAAGSSDFERQRDNILSLGFDEDMVTRLFVTNPSRAIAHRVS